MQILEPNLRFTGDLNIRRTTKRIIIHHSDSDQGSAALIHGWHLARGWSGIGYQYVINKDGTIERGRPEKYVGAHAGAAGNSDSIGICLAGKLDNYLPTNQQIDSLVWLIKDIESRYGDLAVIGHKDVMATACPGKYFPWAVLNKRLEGKIVEQWKLDIIKEAEKAGLVMPNVHAADEPAPKWFVLAVAFNTLKEAKGENK